MPTVDLSKLEEMKALQEQLEALKADASEDLSDLVTELEKAIEGWGVFEVVPRINFILSSLGYEAEYVGIFREEVQREILRRINNAANHVAKIDGEEVEKISLVPDCNCRTEDVRKTLRHMIGEGVIASHNPDHRKGRHSHYCLAPVSKPKDPVDPATIRGGQPPKDK